MATAFMGYLLPWGQMSFWGATVITNFFSAFPIVGEPIVEWLRGGFVVDNDTLNRFFSLHYLVPFILVGLVALHIWSFHVVGNNNPTGVEVKSVEADTVSFHPYYTIKDSFAIVVFMILYVFLIFYAPNFLGEPDNYIRANSLVTPAEIVPEWYFLPFYAILRAVPDKLGGVLVMFAAIGILFLLPWLDTSKVRSATFRPWYRQFFFLFLATAIGLGYLGGQPASGGYVVAARILTAYYFAYFLIILPIVGLIETPKKLPESIAMAVLDKHKIRSDGGSSGDGSADEKA